jgi:C-terminal processing protease CtpA/Prc
MLAAIQTDIKKNYYDPSFHGNDLDAHFKEADEKIKQAASLNEVLGIIASAVMAFNDSHTYFDPPRRATRVEHGWQIQMIGDNCYIVAVQPGSDAEAKGLKPGQRVLSVEGVNVTRKDLPNLQYIFYVLSPRTGMNLVVEKPDGQRSQLTVMARVHESKTVIDLQTGMASDRSNLTREWETLARLNRHRYYEFGNDVFLWKMPHFDLPDGQIDELMDKVKKRQALVLDLRGNSGGAESVLLRLIGHFFDHDIKVGELKRRSETEPLVAKARGNRPFTGKLVVLVDSDSGSASEVFARVIQLEKRGTVIGDRSAGLVMRGKSYDHQIGQNLLVYYGMVVTDANLISSDGKSLEKIGVTPDELMLPTANDLAAGRDPVLAHAARLAGLDITSEKAGTLFPVEWRK